MEQVEKMDVRQAHQYFSKTCFNDAWTLIEKQDKAPAERDAMIHLAHASLFHWTRRADCTDQNLSVGYWQLARVYALAGMGESAVHYAKTCLTFSQQHGVAPVFLGYAYEALARAYKAVNNDQLAESFLKKTRDLAQTLSEDDREQLLSDLATLE